MNITKHLQINNLKNNNINLENVNIKSKRGVFSIFDYHPIFSGIMIKS